MTFVLAWVAFPIVLGGLGLGWGLVIEELSGVRLASGALLIPVGLGGALVVAALLTTNGTTAGLAVPVGAIVAVGGLIRARMTRPEWPVPDWAVIAAIGVLLAYGAPVLATGTTTFTGFIKLDDTSTWLGITDHLFRAGRSTAGLHPSTFKLLLDTNLGTSAYPVGGFMLLGLGRGLVGVDLAWVYQPYLACAGAALAMCLYALSEPLVEAVRLRALIAFIGAQPALLYGYSLWGGIKEMTAAFLLALIAALGVQALRERPAGARATVPLAVATAALIVTFGPGTAVWVVPAFGVIVGVWLVSAIRRSGDGGLGRVAGAVGGLGAATLVLALPVWLLLSTALSTDATFANGTGAGSAALSLGNLRGPLSAFEAAGLWPTGDFRDALPGGVLPIALIMLVVGAAVVGVGLAAMSRSFGPLFYAGIVLVGCVAIDVAGGVPWVIGKALAIASPAILFAGLIGGAILWARSRPAGIVVIGLIAGGVLYSNALGYHQATIGPPGELSDLEHIGTLVGGKGPTFVNDFAVYADRYFLRAGDPVEPAEFRSVLLPLSDGTVLTKSAAADLDSFDLSTLTPYRSIVTPSAPTESRPSSLYHLVWSGRHYQLWQRPARAAETVLSHIPFGDSTKTPYCGSVQAPAGGTAPAPKQICSIQPAEAAPCSQVRAIAGYAASHRAVLVAAERPLNIYARGDQVTRPSRWGVTPSAGSISPLYPGTASLRIKVAKVQHYALWLGGSFGRGFEVGVDGRALGRVVNEQSMIDGYAPVADFVLGTGVHMFTFTYPKVGLGPGTGDQLLTTLSAVVFAPVPQGLGQLTTVSPRQASSLCGKSVDWIEVVRPTA
ncbi:MAG: hypothetical protein QOH12_1844 [Solirubrobacteraceae bacterium]|nr:hypothetical protein [Solirubrobacteraceae bacterium]